jgi:hypothetical protein
MHPITMAARDALRAGALARAAHWLLWSALLAALCSGAAAAEPAVRPEASVRQACADDVHRLCADVAPGGGRIRQCFIAKRDNLSAACKDALLAARRQAR